jgi:hypothetical protein
MNIPTPEASAAELCFAGASTPVYSSRPSEIEITVGLFDEFRKPIFRYVLSLGVPRQNSGRPQNQQRTTILPIVDLV